MVGIISNVAALSAQSNLSRASQESQASIYRLSSGNAIYRASDDVAGLAVGTILKTNVSTLKSALTNTAQASSLLGVADAALQNIGDILQRQKALATQATSGSLTDSARSFLNQEFQNLKQEIDRISSTTNFNGIKLIDGSLYAPSSIGTKTANNATLASGTITIATAANAAAEYFRFSAFGTDVDFSALTDANYAAATTDTQLLRFGLTTVASAVNQADYIYQRIQDISHYAGTDATVLSAKSVLSKFTFTHTTGQATLGVAAKAGGILNNGTSGLTVGASTGTAADVTYNGQNMGTTAAVGLGTGTGGVVGAAGDLSAGTFSTGTNAYTGTTRTIAQGTIGDGILRALTTTAVATTGFDASSVSNNKDFVGNIIEKSGGFQTTFVANNVVNMSIQVGDYTYKAEAVYTNPTANTAVTFSSVESGGGTFTIQMAANGGSAVTDQTAADTFNTRINAAVNGLTFFQKRDVNSYNAAGTIYGTPGGTATGDLAGSSFQLIHSDFSSLKVEDIKISAPVLGGSNATISVMINGEKYVSGFTSTGAVSALGTTVAGAASIGLVSETNPKNVLVFTNGSTTLDLSTAANAAAAQTAFINAFGINSGASGLSFQVGTDAADKVGVSIKSSKTTDIYKDTSGNFLDVSIDTQSNATAANTVIDNAIKTITSVRASVGALQSRFNYASTNLQSAIENQDAARGTFLDADVSAESTKYAGSQVRVQASISVLAQANQLPQNLLKLIG